MTSKDKKERLQEFETMPVGRLLWKYSVPAVVGIMVMSIYNVIDRIFIGQGVGPDAIGGKTSVSVVMNRSRRCGGAERSRDLVEIVVRICVGHGVVAEEQMVADVVIGVGEELGADCGGKDFRTVVIGESRINGRDARCPSGADCRAGEGVKDVGVGFNWR